MVHGIQDVIHSLFDTTMDYCPCFMHSALGNNKGTPFGLKMDLYLKCYVLSVAACSHEVQYVL